MKLVKLLIEAINEDSKRKLEDLFKENPEFASTGTIDQYMDYLGTIFPSSKIKDIMYHGATEQRLPKDGKFKGYVTYFTDNKNYAQTFGFSVNRKIIMAVLDVNKPYMAPSELADVPEEIHNTDVMTNPRIIKRGKSDHDAVIGKDAGQKEGYTVAVFEPDQIHVLGTPKDLEGFRSYVKR